MDKAKFGLHVNLQAFGTITNALKSAFTYMYGIKKIQLSWISGDLQL